MNPRIREIARVGLFSALAVAGGYIFLAVPNVEVFTATVFLAGLLLGSRDGMLVGFISQTLFSTLNPLGISPPPLFVAQVAHRILVGFIGGRFKYNADESDNVWLRGFRFGALGLLLTWAYDLMTDFSFFLVSGFTLDQIKTTLTLGLPFYLIHGGINTIIFAVVLPFVLKVVERMNVIKIAD